jgi:hypothetical protein
MFIKLDKKSDFKFYQTFKPQLSQKKTVKKSFLINLMKFWKKIFF